MLCTRLSTPPPSSKQQQQQNNPTWSYPHTNSNHPRYSDTLDRYHTPPPTHTASVYSPLPFFLLAAALPPPLTPSPPPHVALFDPSRLLACCSSKDSTPHSPQKKHKQTNKHKQTDDKAERVRERACCWSRHQEGRFTSTCPPLPPSFSRSLPPSSTSLPERRPASKDAAEQKFESIVCVLNKEASPHTFSSLPHPRQNKVK